MAIQFMQMPRIGQGVDTLLDFAPLAGAIGDYQTTRKSQLIGDAARTGGNTAAAQEAMKQGQLDTGAQYQRLAQQETDRATQSKDRQIKMLGGVAQAAKFEKDPARRALIWQTGLKRAGVNPADLDPDELDPMTGPDVFLAASGMAQDPREDRMADIKLRGAELDNQYRQAQIADIQTRRSTDMKREEQLTRMGIDPNSAEGIAFLANGKLPAATIEQRVQAERRASTSPNIAAGLQNLNQMADTYNDPAFESAVGPIQGATPDGLLSSIPINIARLYGEVTSRKDGGNANPSEVRSNIVGATETLAAAIKPLIRAPGEGVWTDADQARLVAIVGDLSQARDKAEFRRRLNAVRDRIKSNFNLDIPFEAMEPDGSALQGRGNLPIVGGNDSKAALKQKYGVDLE